MTIHDIKIGDNLKEFRRKTFADDCNVVVSTLPSFCDSRYKEVYNIDNSKERVFVLADDNDIVIDITDQFSKAVDCDKAEQTMNYILDSF